MVINTIGTMARELNIREQIAFIGANSVTDEEYREFWGESREEAREDMRDFMREFDAKMEAEVYNQLAEDRRQPAVEPKVAAADYADKKEEEYETNRENGENQEQKGQTVNYCLIWTPNRKGSDVKMVFKMERPEHDSLESIINRITELVESQQRTWYGRKLVAQCRKEKGRIGLTTMKKFVFPEVKELDIVKKWREKLAALQTGSGKSYPMEAPVLMIGDLWEGEETLETHYVSIKRNLKMGKYGKFCRYRKKELLGRLYPAVMEGEQIRVMESGEGLPVALVTDRIGVPIGGIRTRKMGKGPKKRGKH